MHHLLLRHCRRALRLTPRQIEDRTGIPAERYKAYEEDGMHIPDLDATLLGSVLGADPADLASLSLQLEFFHGYNILLRSKGAQIDKLTKALQRSLAREFPARAAKPSMPQTHAPKSSSPKQRGRPAVQKSKI
jgi:transcriptional regulator with XRE-family HTH domain